MFFKYKKKYNQLLADNKINKDMTDKIYELNQQTIAMQKENIAICQDGYQALFKDYKEARGIIDTIKEIRAGGKFTGKQGAEIDKLIN
jgi:hypothetical protein